MHIGSRSAELHSVSSQDLGLASLENDGLVLIAAAQMQLGSTGVTAHSDSLHLRRFEGGVIGPDGAAAGSSAGSESVSVEPLVSSDSG